MKPRVLNPPDRIYLNYGDLDEDCKHEDCAEVTWCADKIGNSDVEYRRVKPAKRQAARERKP